MYFNNNALLSRESATGGCPEAMVTYLIDYDKRKVDEWGMKAMESGSLYASGICYFSGIGVLKHSKAVFEDFMKSNVEQNCIESFHMLGLCFEHGWGVARNMELALEWWMKGSAEGDPMCQHALGIYYFSQNNTEEAMKWYKKAAKCGHSSSIYQMHMWGDNPTRSWYWRRKYQALGYESVENPIFICFDRCEAACNTLMLIRKHCVSVLNVFPKDVVRLIAKQLWETREEKCWESLKRIKV